MLIYKVVIDDGLNLCIVPATCYIVIITDRGRVGRVQEEVNHLDLIIRLRKVQSICLVLNTKYCS